LFGNPETTKTLGRDERRWEESITIDIDEIQLGGGGKENSFVSG